MQQRFLLLAKSTNRKKRFRPKSMMRKIVDYLWPARENQCTENEKGWAENAPSSTRDSNSSGTRERECEKKDAVDFQESAKRATEGVNRGNVQVDKRRTKSAPMSTSACNSEKSGDESSDDSVSDHALTDYFAWMHRGGLVPLIEQTWLKAAQVHLQANVKVHTKIRSGSASLVELIEFVERPSDCEYLDDHAQYVRKTITQSTERKTREFRTLRMLADCERERNARYFALPLEMWCEEARSVLVALMPKYECDLFDFERANEGQKMSYTKVGIILEQVTQALCILHDNYNIVHNDIKPENVVIDVPTMQCRICDFGGAVMLNSDQDDLFVQTLLYASPERHQKRKCDTKSDIWSLGIMACELRRCRDVDELVPEERWLQLLRQPQTTTPSGRKKFAEWLDEPEVLPDLCSDGSDPLAQPFCAFLHSTVRHLPRQRSSAAKLLRQRNCASLLRVKSIAAH